MKLIIAGSRDFNDYELLKKWADLICFPYKRKEDIEIVSGGAKGADALGERYAFERGYKVKIFKAEWNKYGKSAGPMRNFKMAEYADTLLAFWDGKSKGTKNMITHAQELELNCEVVHYAEQRTEP